MTLAWAEIASANGMRMHAGVRLGSITGSQRYESEAQPGVFDQPPETGNLPRDLLDALSGVLARHTSTPGTCYFAVWDGWGWFCRGPFCADILGSTAQLSPAHRAR